MDETTYSILFNSALGDARRLGTDFDVSTVAQRLRSMNPAFANLPYMDFVRIAQAAQRTNAWAGSVTDDPTRIHPVREYPTDPTIPDGAERFAWRVVVTWDDGAGNRGETLVVVRTDVNISADMARHLAQNQVALGTQESTTNLSVRPSTSSMTSYIVSVGQRR